MLRQHGELHEGHRSLCPGAFLDGGTIYFNFTPAPGSSTGEVLLVEKLEGTFDLAKGQSTVLKYDDTAPFTDYQPMPFCLHRPA